MSGIYRGLGGVIILDMIDGDGNEVSCKTAEHLMATPYDGDAFAESGDSGSLVYNNEKEIVGELFRAGVWRHFSSNTFMFSTHQKGERDRSFVYAACVRDPLLYSYRIWKVAEVVKLSRQAIMLEISSVSLSYLQYCYYRIHIYQTLSDR